MNPYTWHGNVPEGYPRQCYAFDFSKRNSCLQGKIWKTVTGQNLASVLEKACDLCDWDSPCVAFTVTNNTTAQIFSHTSSRINPPAGTNCVSGEWAGHWGGAVGMPIGGKWYSTPETGQCADGEPLGRNGCTWRYIGNASYRDAECVDSHIDDAVEKHGMNCFIGCPRDSKIPQSFNKTTICYNECYEATLEGDPEHNITAMDPEQVREPWRKAFLKVEEGGCPEIHNS